jgi:hypothetical protein
MYALYVDSQRRTAVHCSLQLLVFFCTTHYRVLHVTVQTHVEVEEWLHFTSVSALHVEGDQIAALAALPIPPPERERADGTTGWCEGWAPERSGDFGYERIYLFYRE